MMTLDTGTHAQARWHLFEDTKAWLAHVAAIEAGIDLRHGRKTSLQRQWLDEQGWGGEA